MSDNNFNSIEDYTKYIVERKIGHTKLKFEMGQALIESKIKFFDTSEGTEGGKARKFNKWVKDELKMAKSTVNNYMRIYSRLGISGSGQSHFETYGMDMLKVLIAFPEELSGQEIFEMIDGKTDKEIKDLKSQLVPAKKPATQAEELEKLQAKAEKVLSKTPDNSLSPEGYLKFGEEISKTVKDGTTESARQQARVEGIQLDIEDVLNKEEPLLISAPKEEVVEQLMSFSVEEINAMAMEAKRKTQFIIKDSKKIYIPFFFFCGDDRMSRDEFQTEDDLKKHYRKWAKFLHSDTGGDDSHFKRLDTEYRALIGNNDAKRKFMKEYPRREW